MCRGGKQVVCYMSAAVTQGDCASGVSGYHGALLGVISGSSMCQKVVLCIFLLLNAAPFV